MGVMIRHVSKYSWQFKWPNWSLGYVIRKVQVIYTRVCLHKDDLKKLSFIYFIHKYSNISSTQNSDSSSRCSANIFWKKWINKWDLGELLGKKGDGEQSKINFTCVLWPIQVLTLTKCMYFKVHLFSPFSF